MLRNPDGYNYFMYIKHTGACKMCSNYYDEVYSLRIRIWKRQSYNWDTEVDRKRSWFFSLVDLSYKGILSFIMYTEKCLWHKVNASCIWMLLKFDHTVYFNFATFYFQSNW